MHTAEKARRVLEQARSSLKGLIEEAVRDQNFSEVAEIAVLAEALSRVIVGARPGDSTPTVAPARRPVLRAKPAPKGAGSPLRKPKYPRFERDGDRLVKVGWSKKNRAEYEHRAPHQAVVQVARHIANRVRVGQVFEVESILPVPDTTGGEVPAYQVYLILAWFRSAGAVVKKGRDGQILRDGSIGSDGLKDLWEQVPVRAN